MTLSRRELSKMDIAGINSHCHDRGAGLLTLRLGEYRDYEAPAGQRLVVGLHPWDTEGWELQRLREELSVAISDSRVVAIGEVARSRGSTPGGVTARAVDYGDRGRHAGDVSYSASL